ncbi:UDP-glucose 4-epimerase [Roseovarius gaetbuli]|uniref:UDP-glucose 4-epimerase n=1 Tax=Roseovarius gaetbuli TaxID=1356575 RepID=A0A1X6Z4B6_9RHOB|nr:UDP-glucose 4-epimerase GalE [Roseovarius gaetbuli]SLN38382.1 UDP-glucose 4-epimerase [Roseovarius gaetbuli]
MTGKPVLVTGGAGYIGSHVCKHLSRSGYTPVVIDNLSVGHATAVKWGPLIEADIRDTAAVASALAKYGIEMVMHFAASAYVGESVKHPITYYDNNVGGMISLVKACQEGDVRTFILSSSCATYGTPEIIPISEQTPQRPVNPYGETKLICEHILRDVEAAHGMRFAALRYFNAAGADPEGELCERHAPETHVIPLALMAASGRITEFEVYGTDYPTPDGSCVRDYIHVQDLARGHVAALARLEAGAESFAVNLGSGKGHSVLELLALIERLSGKRLPVRHQPRRIGDPAILVADPSKARALLDLTAERSDLETLIRDAAPSFGVEVA